MESCQEVKIFQTFQHEDFTDFQAPGRVREGKEDQDDIKRFLTFSDVEDDETETKRKDSNFVTFARRMSCMVLGEKGRDLDLIQK